MRLLEWCRGNKTSKDNDRTCMQLAKEIGKVAVLVGTAGFVGTGCSCRNFGKHSFWREGASPSGLTRRSQNGVWHGAARRRRSGGLDVAWRIRKGIQALEKPGARQPYVEDKLCEMGRFGQKTGGLV